MTTKDILSQIDKTLNNYATYLFKDAFSRVIGCDGCKCITSHEEIVQIFCSKNAVYSDDWFFILEAFEEDICDTYTISFYNEICWYGKDVQICNYPATTSIGLCERHYSSLLYWK